MPTWFYSTSATLTAQGGQATRALEVCRALARYVDVVVFAPLGRDFSPSDLPSNLRFVDVPVPPSPPRNWSFQINLVRAMRAFPPPQVYYTYAGSVNWPSLWYARQ